ncbi:MAG: MBL fold metallo-hydrolase [Acidobacteria bacterium]|nr:MBL fold metallo-hydrolase [Acidobacteriota bacterium]
MKTSKIFFLLILSLSLAFMLVGEDFDWSKVEIKDTKLNEGIYMFEGMGGNMTVLCRDSEALIVDGMFPPLFEKIIAKIESLGGKKIKYMINTHIHDDHIANNPNFRKAGAQIIAHENLKKRLTEKGRTDFLPDVTFKDEKVIDFHGIKVRLIYMPSGHTDTDIVLFFDDLKVVTMGDLYFARRFPYIDLKQGGSVKGFIKNNEKLLSEIPDGYKIVPGHGPLSTKEDLKNDVNVLKETIGIIQAKIDNGLSEEEILKEGLPEKYKNWEWQFINTERWIKIIYSDLNKK